MSNGQLATREITVWDLPLRLFHWALALCVIAAIVTAELGDEVSDIMEWHRRLGYTVLTLLIFRLIWGFTGGTHARFSSFLKGPGAIRAYLRNASTGNHVNIGHNPLGALSVLALIAATLFQAFSGLFITDEVMVEGPLFKHVSNSLADALGELHEGNGTIIIGLIVLHIAAILFYRFVKRDNLVLPMITGKKSVPASLPVQEARGGSTVVGIFLFAIVAFGVWYFVTHV